MLVCQTNKRTLVAHQSSFIACGLSLYTSSMDSETTDHSHLSIYTLCTYGHRPQLQQYVPQQHHRNRCAPTDPGHARITKPPCTTTNARVISDNYQYIRPGCHPLVVTERSLSQHAPPYWRAVAYDGHHQLAGGNFGKLLCRTYSISPPVWF